MVNLFQVLSLTDPARLTNQKCLSGSEWTRQFAHITNQRDHNYAFLLYIYLQN